MHKITFTAICLAFMGRARRVQPSLKPARSSPSVASHRPLHVRDTLPSWQPDSAREVLNGLAVLDMLLANFDSAAAFNPSGMGVPCCMRELRRPESSRPSMASSDGGSMVCLEQPHTGQRVTLIGTAHLSAASNEQVAREIRSRKPGAVIVELDPNRLERLKFKDEDFVVPYRTSKGIEPPPTADEIARAERIAAGNGWWWRPGYSAALGLATKVIRRLATKAYDGMGKEEDLQPGGEFVEAIKAANELGVPCVLADRDSIDTIRRCLDLVLRSDTGVFGVLRKWKKVNRDLMEPIEQALIAKGKIDYTTQELIEEIKQTPGHMDNLGERLGQEVPEMARGLIEERDYIMAKTICRELDGPSCPSHVCAVIGAGHLPGIERYLKDASLVKGNF